MLALLVSVRLAWPFEALLLLLAQALTGFLVHCPAHYLVGTILGMRFRSIRVGHTSLANALPPGPRRLALLLPVLSLAADRESLRGAGPARLRAMYLSGVTASVSAGFAFAVAATMSGDFLAAFLTWAYALAYLATDAFLSPEWGDVRRAKMAARR